VSHISRLMGGRRIDLRDEIAAKFGVQLHERTVGRLMERLKFSHVSAGPRSSRAGWVAREAHKKFATLVAAVIPEHPSGPIEFWLRRSPGRPARQPDLRLSTEGQPPRKPRDQRYKRSCIFGAVCPARGVGAALILPCEQVGNCAV